MKYLQGKGYRVLPVNPVAAGQTILGEQVYADLQSLPAELAATVTMVDVFRNAKAAGPITEEALELVAAGAMPSLRCVWMQLGVRNEEARESAEAAGLTVV